ncbi:MAG TPA: DUF6600 domain-containing protein [Candidatus Limnocylindrales bacterium]|nr:DUF6600 domain-containing protein [Candidatus Limnocylindrales bacterium]
MGRLRYRLPAAAAALVLTAGGLLAQAPPPDQQQVQPADDLQRGVALISLMNGEVSVQRGDSGEWVAGVLNAPLMSDDRIATGANSRAEVQFDASNLLRIGGNAQLKLTTLEYGRYQMEFAKGTMTYRVLRAGNANIEIDTPSVSVRPSKVGAYRISVNDAGETEVTVRAGDLEVFTPRGSQWLSTGQSMMARGNSSDPEFQIVAAIPVDDWDRWNDSRDRVFLNSVSAQYVDPAQSGIYGTEELDNYGTWTEVPTYGRVWRPTESADWAPYRAGRWVWEDWYGWTWVSYDPWGWAPYHYGRWFYETNFGWCWYPGLIHTRHYWSPALVAWFGYGGGVGVGFGFGNIGWVPLAPYEVFHPWWGRGFYGRRDFARNISITNVNIYNNYRNARFNGVSGLSTEAFRGGRFSSIGRVGGEQVRSAGLVRGTLPVQPGNAHLNFSDRQAAFTPRTAANQRFFTHQQPAGPSRIPFSQQRGAVEQAGGAGRQFGGNGRQQLGGAMGRTNDRPGTASAPSNGGWRRFGEPGNGQSQAPAAGRNEQFRGNAAAPQMQNTRPQQSGGNSGWGRFGEPGAGRQFGGRQQAAPQSQPRYEQRPSYSAPAQRPSYSEPQRPSYSAPAQRPSYSAPRQSAPSYSAPRGNSGGGGGGRPSGGGGGGGHAGGGGGHGRR